MSNNMRRVGFTFDKHSLKSLDDMQSSSGLPTPATAVKESLQVLQAIQTQAAQGYTQLSVRNPETGEERPYIGPPLSGS
jgi:hypothetical protein